MPFFNFKEKNIHYLSEGLGPVIVLLHGYLENISMWDEIAEKLGKTNHVVRLDFPGFGKSECIEHENGMALYAEITAQLLALLNIDKYALIGHSMGGYVALELASSYPKKTSQLILFHSTAQADSEEKKTMRNRALKALSKKNAYLKTAIKLLFPSPFQKTCKRQIDKMIQEASILNTNGIAVALAGMRERKEHAKTVQDLTCKTTYIAGKLDPVLDSRQVKIEAQNNKAQYIELENAGHMSHWESNEKATTTLLNTLRINTL